MVESVPAYGNLYPPSYSSPAPVAPAAPALPLAGALSRFGAVIVDGLLGSIIMMPGYILLLVTAEPSGEMNPIGGIFFAVNMVIALAFILYNIYLLGRDGATIGKRLLGLKVLDQTGSPIGFGRAFLRELCKGTISSWVCYLGLLWMLWDKEKQTWHDKILNTHVYHARG